MSETEPQPASAGSGFSQSLERGLLILSCYGENRSMLGIAELSRLVELNKSTTYRYVATLAKLGYLQQDASSKKYFLGPRVVDLGFAAINSLEVSRVAAPHLQNLADQTGCTVSMATLDGADIVYLDRRRSDRPGSGGIDLNLQVGSRLPAYCTSMGKLLLAFIEPAALRSVLDRTDLARRGPKTITSREQLMANLKRIAASGIAIDDEELAPGFRSIATPLRDRTGDVVAAMNIAVHLTGTGGSIEILMDRLEVPLRRTAVEISLRMGYRADR